MTELESRWFDEGTAADVAAAINKNRIRVKWRSPHWVKQQWAMAQKRGDLPPTIVRPHNGFPPGPRQIMLRVYELMKEGKAA